MTPKQAVRKMCVQCVQSPYQVANCGGDRMLGTGGDENHVCYFFPYRMGDGRPKVKTIRKFCLECMGGNKALVSGCTTTSCPLHPFRFGKNPNRARTAKNPEINHDAEASFYDEI